MSNRTIFAPDDRLRREGNTLARQAIGQIQRELAAFSRGSYDGPDDDRLMHGSLVAGGSQDRHLTRTTLDELRRKCQHQDRTNPIARSMIDRLIDLTVGDGHVFQPASGNPDFDEVVSALWNEWADSTDCDARGLESLHGIAAQTVRAGCTDGDAGGVLTDQGTYQAIEGERIRDKGWSTDIVAGTGQPGVVQGVEMDRAGKPIAYHVASWDISGTLSITRTTRVPAESFVFFRSPIRTTPGGTRGEPALAACLRRLEHLDKLDEAVVTAARVHACLSAYVTSEHPEIMRTSWPGQTTDRNEPDNDATAERESELKPGTLNFLRPGEAITAINPSQPGPDYADFTLLQLSLCGASIGLPLPAFTLDGRQVNLATIRSIMALAWRNMERWHAALCERFYRRIAKWRIGMWIDQGVLPMVPGWDRFSFVPPAPVMMDPKTEIEAAKMMVDNRFDSRSGIMARVFGKDARVEDERSAEDVKRLEELDIPAVAMPGSRPQSEPTSKPEPET